MSSPLISGLSDLVGTQSAGQFATAYEAVILAVSHGRLEKMPDRETRTAIFEAMLLEGRRSGFYAELLAEAGVIAARRSPGFQPASL